MLCALRDRAPPFPRQGLLNTYIDLPLAVSPVVISLALFFSSTRHAAAGSATGYPTHGFQVLFALPAIVLSDDLVWVPVVRRAR